MKFPVFRGFLFGCFAMMASVLSIGVTAPAHAVEVGIQSHYSADLDFVLVCELVDVAATEEAKAPTYETVELGPVPPVYLLSWRTAVHSLSDYHLRC